MLWLKRHLFFAIGGVLALVMMAWAGYFLYDQRSQNATVTEDWSAQQSAFEQLNNKDPHPGTESVDNVKAATEDLKRIQEFLAESRKVIPVMTPPEKLDDSGFKSFLGKTIYDLQTNAGAAGVTLPQDYSFTFAPQRKSLSFNTSYIEPWLIQLEDIKTLCGILYAAKINALESIRRVPVAPTDTGTGDFISARITTNDLTVVSPYEIVFRGFSTEVAAVLQGFSQANDFFVIKAVDIKPTSAQSSGGIGGGENMPGIPTPAAARRGQPAMPPAAGDAFGEGPMTMPSASPSRFPTEPRFGGGGQAGGGGEGPVAGGGASFGTSPFAMNMPATSAAMPRPAPITPQIQRPVAQPSIVTILDESPLHVTLLLDLVKSREAKGREKEPKAQ